MKILMLEFWGSFNRHSINLCRELCRQGLDLTLVTVEDCAVDPPLPCRVLRIFPSFTRGRGGLSKLCNYVRAYGKVVSYALSERIDVVHFQYFRLLYADWFFVLIMKLLRIKLIYNAHNVMPHEIRWYHPFIFRLVYRLSDLVIVTSQQAENQVRSEFKVNPDRVVQIPIGNPGLLGPDQVPKDRARKLLQIAEDKRFFLQFGVIRDYKGIDVLIEALSRMGPDGANLLCIVTGQCDDEDLLQKLERLISAKGVTDRIQIRKRFLSDQDIVLYMSACDAVLLPYKKASGQSGVLLLAYAFARPVIASAVGGMTDMVEHGKSGYLVPAADPENLAGTIRLALQDEKKLCRMGRYARQLNEEKYSWSSIASATFRAYRLVLGGIPARIE